MLLLVAASKNLHFGLICDQGQNMYIYPGNCFFPSPYLRDSNNCSTKSENGTKRQQKGQKLQIGKKNVPDLMSLLHIKM